jgi:hypothetical protein
MKLVLTLLVRSAAEVIDAQIAYHLNAGVDLVVATADKRSPQDSVAVVSSFERDGGARMLRADDDTDEGASRTRMARLAATELDADWVINAESNEFWWPRGESLHDVLAPIPPRYTVVQGLRRIFVDETHRHSSADAANGGFGSAEEALRPVHRADPGAVIGADGTVTISRQVPLRAWYPLEVFQLPAEERVAGAEDSLVGDTRLRDAVRAVREGRPLLLRTPDVVDDAAYAVECAAVGEVDLPRLEQYVSELEQRVGWLEQRLWPRILRAAARLVRRRAR